MSRKMLDIIHLSHILVEQFGDRKLDVRERIMRSDRQTMECQSLAQCDYMLLLTKLQGAVQRRRGPVARQVNIEALYLAIYHEPH